MLEQRAARIHRLGQQRPIRVIHFVARGTIEEGMLSVLAFKRSLAAGILDGAGADVALGGSRLARFMKEIEAVTGAGTQLLEALASAGQPADGGPAHGPVKLRRMSGSRPVRTHFCAM